MSFAQQKRVINTAAFQERNPASHAQGGNNHKENGAPIKYAWL